MEKWIVTHVNLVIVNAFHAQDQANSSVVNAYLIYI